MMVVALTLLLLALGFILYRDRDFWFPDTQQAEDQPLLSAPGGVAAPKVMAVARSESGAPRKTSHSSKPHARGVTTPTDPATVPVTAVQRTVLPPLEVEVIAGNVRRAVHPGNNSVRVDLQPGSASQDASEPASENSAEVTNAAERVQISAETAEIVGRPVEPGYPLLARQMKVQGSVILQALIGRDGLIQDLRVISGPPILASAAEEAVKQWHFKPHFQGRDAVETQAKITVNFTISTN